MKTRLTPSARFLFFSVTLLTLTMVGIGVTADQTLTGFVAKDPKAFKFPNETNPDAVVKLYLDGAESNTDGCQMKVTRKDKGSNAATAKTYFDGLCDEAWYKNSLPIKEPKYNDPTKGQYSSYFIEFDGTCTDEDRKLPINVEIANYADREMDGDAVKLRLIHFKDPDCSDITYYVSVDDNPANDERGGGGDPTKSEFFLVNVPDKFAEDDKRIVSKICDLAVLTHSNFSDGFEDISDALVFFENGVASSDDGKRKDNLEKSIKKLEKYLDDAKDAKKNGKFKKNKKANRLIARPKRVIFDICNYMRKGKISTTNTKCKDYIEVTAQATAK